MILRGLITLGLLVMMMLNVSGQVGSKYPRLYMIGSDSVVCFSMGQEVRLRNMRDSLELFKDKVIELDKGLSLIKDNQLVTLKLYRDCIDGRYNDKVAYELMLNSVISDRDRLRVMIDEYSLNNNVITKENNDLKTKLSKSKKRTRIFATTATISTVLSIILITN